MTEAEFTRSLVEAAERLGWLVHHDESSSRFIIRGADVRRVRNARPGFPDLVLAHPSGRVVYAELKADLGPKGGGPKPTPEQEAWLRALRASGAEVYVWRPADIDDAYRLLAEPSARVR